MARILVVDDDPDVCQLLRQALQRHGHRVLTADTAPEAVAQVALPIPVDLLIADLFLPWLGGLDVIEEIRKRSPATRLLVTSAGATDIALPMDAARIVHKPFTLSTLLEAVDEALRPSR